MYKVGSYVYGVCDLVGKHAGYVTKIDHDGVKISCRHSNEHYYTWHELIKLTALDCYILGVVTDV